MADSAHTPVRLIERERRTPSQQGDRAAAAPRSRRHWSDAEKRFIIEQSLLPGVSASSVARHYGIPPHQLFRWRKRFQQPPSTESADSETSVPARYLLQAQGEIRALRRQLQEITRETQRLRQMMERRAQG